MAILAVNAGSSTLKFSVYPLLHGQVQASLLSGCIEGLEPAGIPMLSWTIGGRRQQRQIELGAEQRFAAALNCLKALLEAENSIPALAAVAHRVVHGGHETRAGLLVTEALLDYLAQFNALAPLHQPHNLQGIRAFSQAFPGLPQVACFDNAFHASMAAVDYSFALPQSLTDQGLRRYGFHGLSYQYVISALQQHSKQADGRVLMAHLGNGASLCAARHGRSCATTMGFSTLDGLMMGTRSGSIDAGLLLYLMSQGWDHERLQTLLYRQSGLLGVSGLSADMRRLRSDGSQAARKAIDLFTHRILHESGALIACLGGLDLLAFTGGIGEHDALLRADLCASLDWLGVKLDALLNQQACGSEAMAIHRQDSQVQVWVIPTDEGSVAARLAAALL